MGGGKSDGKIIVREIDGRNRREEKEQVRDKRWEREGTVMEREGKCT